MITYDDIGGDDLGRINGYHKMGASGGCITAMLRAFDHGKWFSLRYYAIEFQSPHHIRFGIGAERIYAWAAAISDCGA